MDCQMNSIITAKALSTKKRFADRQWFYDFRELTRSTDEKNAKKIASSLSNRYSKLTKDWDDKKNSEWLCRIYFSAKMIMTATLQINSMQYAKEHNIRITTSYLTYYSLLALLRGIVYTLPEEEWNDGKLIEISHNKAIDLAFNHLDKFNKELSKEFKKITQTAKAYRELISYRSPTSGDHIIESISIRKIATLLAEVAQFNSEILESSIIKHTNGASFDFLYNYMKKLFKINIGGINFVDKEDDYRLDYLRRKYPLPPNILHIMTEGHVEDFFGAWLPSEEIKGAFDPDKNWGIIFDIP